MRGGIAARYVFVPGGGQDFDIGSLVADLANADVGKAQAPGDARGDAREHRGEGYVGGGQAAQVEQVGQLLGALAQHTGLAGGCRVEAAAFESAPRVGEQRLAECSVPVYELLSGEAGGEAQD